MEAALKDFEEWVNSLPIQEVKYYAEFDPDSGKVLGIFPDYAATDLKYKIEVDEFVANSVAEGTTSLMSYAVDLTTADLEFIEIKSLTKIDDVLHRIIDKKWSLIEDPDIILNYDRDAKTLTIELSEKYRHKKIHWNGTTEMLYLVTDYNDPNGLRYNLSVTINELIGKQKVFENIEVPIDYSVYTRRIFKNYIIEEK
jgi:hypothetical protein